MRKTIVLVFCALLFGLQAAHAVDLQDCSKGTTKKRLACLQANIVLLNASYQQVAAELRQATAALQTGEAGLKQGLADLNTKVAAIPPAPDVSQFVRKDQGVKLGIDGARCLSATSGESGEIPANPRPIDVRLLVTFQDCNGAPAWSFH